MKTRIIGWILAASVLALVLPASPAQQENVPGQKSFPAIRDSFQFTPGAWAEYNIFDKAKNENYRMWIATLAKETIQGKPYSWLEIEVEMKDSPVVVTSILAEETADGPGRIEKAVVQVKGMSAFNVPKKYLQGQDQEVSQFKPAHVVKKLSGKKITRGDKTIDVLAVEAENEKGEKMTAMVSVQLPPIAICDAETADLKMTAINWGAGAKTKIEGPALPFFLWVIEQAFSAVSVKK